MQIAILNDTHAGCRNSSDIFMDYQERFYSEVFFPYLLENNITQILHLGDYYDNRKTVNFKALAHNRKIFLEKLREYGITMDIIPGNHDVYYKNTNELNALKELQGHYMNEVNLIMEPTEMNYDGLCVGLVPWINPQNEEASLEFLANTKATLIGAHLELQGFEMARGQVCMSGMSKSHFDRFETVLTGHFHAKSSQGNIHYLGSPFPHNYADAWDDDRGMMTLEWGGEPQHITYDGPRYRTVPLSQLIDDSDNILDHKTYCRAILDVNITYEEASFIKETFAEQYSLREITLMPSKKDELAQEGVSMDDFEVENVDQIVYNSLNAVESEMIDKKLLVDIYNTL